MNVTILFERPDGKQYLVTIYEDGIAELAERTDAGNIWSPPLEAEVKK